MAGKVQKAEMHQC